MFCLRLVPTFFLLTKTVLAVVPARVKRSRAASTLSRPGRRGWSGIGKRRAKKRKRYASFFDSAPLTATVRPSVLPLLFVPPHILLRSAHPRPTPPTTTMRVPNFRRGSRDECGVSAAAGVHGNTIQFYYTTGGMSAPPSLSPPLIASSGGYLPLK
ncbi:hypothetical protein K438DRAFT_1863345 [Mycena galopus ATCC 62051]|nr:hypothetical protein K438DRAFT_1863345 [Mycena galopus ATCC 62051]